MKRHSLMNECHRLRKPELVEGSIARSGGSIRAALGKAYETVKTFDGMFYYRLHGEGKQTMTDAERREAREARKALLKIKKALDDVAEASREYERMAKKVDKFMKFT